MKISDITIKVVIADDHEIFRDGLKLMLNAVPNIMLADEAKNGKELITIVDKIKPDVVITDIKMPELDGVEATRYIKEHHPQTEVLALSMFDDEQPIVEMMDAGAIGYLLKNSDKSEVIEAVNNAYMHQPYYCKIISGKLAKLIAFSNKTNEKKKKEAEFSDREKEIIKLICVGYTNKQIGEKLFLSIRTVEGYRMKILEKMEVKNIAGIITEAIKLGIHNPQL